MKYPLTIIALLILALPLTAQPRIQIPNSEIEHSLARLGQPSLNAHRLVQLADAGRIQKADLSLLAAVIRQYESLTVQFCNQYIDEIDPYNCSKESYPFMEALSSGNIALHQVVDKAKGLPLWSWGQGDTRWVTGFRNRSAWGRRYLK